MIIKLILKIASIFRREPVSIQREIIMRASSQRGSWDLEIEDLLHIYDRLNSIVKEYQRKRGIKYSEIGYLLCYPKSSLNLINGKKVPFNDLAQIRKKSNS